MFNEEQIKEIKRLKSLNITNQYIANKLGVNKETIRLFFIKPKLPKIIKQIKKVNKEKLFELKNEGKSYTFIADYFGCSKQRIEQIINNRKYYKGIKRPKILVRDNYTCRFCGIKKTSDKLEVHHADKNTSNNDDLNLITVCIPCHKQAHLH